LTLRREPRINGRGFRVGKIASVYRQHRQVPMLRLSGRWLARAGFEIGQPIEIGVQRGKLTIMVTADPAEAIQHPTWPDRRAFAPGGLVLIPPDHLTT